MDSILSMQHKDITGDGRVYGRENHKLFVHAIHWSLEDHVKIYHGINEPQHLVDPRQMALLKEPYDK